MRRKVRFEGVANIDKTEVDWSILSDCGSIVSACLLVMNIKIALEPLNKFQVILILRLAHFFDIDVLLNFAFGKGLLQNFVVPNELPFILGSPVDL